MSLLVKPASAACGAVSLVLCIAGPALSQTPAATPAPGPAPSSAVAVAPAESGVTALPEIEVVAPRRVQPPRRPKTRVVTGRTRETPAAPPQTPTQVVAGQNERLDEARRSIVAPIGANSYQVNHQTIEALPQGANTTLDKVLLQTPGRIAGLRRQRRTARPQRTRQSAVPHQRHHAAGRRRRLRANPRHRHRRQPRPDYRRAAGAIWSAHRGRAGHPDQGGRLQQFRQRQRLRRQPRHHHAEFRIWRHRRTDPVFRLGTLFRQQCRNRKSDAGLLRRSTITPTRKRVLRTFRR